MGEVDQTLGSTPLSRRGGGATLDFEVRSGGRVGRRHHEEQNRHRPSH